MKKLILIVFCVYIILGVLVLISRDSNEIPATSLSFSGDIMLGRGLLYQLEKNGYQYPYLEIKDTLSNVDISFANLECPLSDTGVPVMKEETIIFKADPKNAYYLKEAGFDVLCLANNHTMDQGKDALMNTIKVLEDNDIVPIGAGKNYQEAHSLKTIDKNGCRFGFLGFTLFPPEGYFHLRDKPDVAFFNENSANEIKEAKAKCDFLIVSYHFGVEYSKHKSDLQKKAAELAIDNGADLVVGHHPHVTQPMEVYKGKYIFYSLGNFIFDRQKHLKTDETVMPIITVVENKLEDYELIPLVINNGQPSIAEGDKVIEILNRFKLKE